MPVTVVDTAGTSLGGYELFTGQTGEAQLNLYLALQSSLAPYLEAVRLIDTRYFVVGIVKGYMTSDVTDFNPLYLSSYIGYPQRFNLGGFRYLQGNRALGGPRWIDCLQWGDDLSMRVWVTQSGTPNFSFPPPSPPPAETFANVVPLRDNQIISNAYNGHIAADGFSYFLTAEVEMSFCFQWQCIVFRFFISTTPPTGVYLINI